MLWTIRYAVYTLLLLLLFWKDCVLVISLCGLGSWPTTWTKKELKPLTMSDKSIFKIELPLSLLFNCKVWTATTSVTFCKTPSELDCIITTVVLLQTVLLLECCGYFLQLSSQILDTMQYLQPSSHRHQVPPAHQPTQSLHNRTSAPFVNGNTGGTTLLGQHLHPTTHRNNTAVGGGTFPTGTTAHTDNAFQPSLCE